MFHSWDQPFRTIGFLGLSPNFNPAWCWVQREGRLIGPCYVFPVIGRPGFMIITPPFSSFSVVFGNQSLATAALPWMLDLWSSRRTVFVEAESSMWILSFAVTFSAEFLWFLDTVLFNVRRYLSFSFGFRPLFFLADYAFPLFVYAINHGNCCYGHTW
jgi:hypothetical protein